MSYPWPADVTEKEKGLIRALSDQIVNKLTVRLDDTLEARLQPLLDKMEQIRRIEWLDLVANSAVSAIRAVANFIGTGLGASLAAQKVPQPLWQQNLRNPVAVRVAYTHVGTPGGQVAISLDGASPPTQVVATIGDAAGLPLISEPFVLQPNDTIFISSSDPAILLVAGDTFQVQIYDPRPHVDGNAWTEVT
jgi:hypothetical protein